MIMTEQKWKGYTQGIRSIKAFEDENKINVSPFLLPPPPPRTQMDKGTRKQVCSSGSFRILKRLELIITHFKEVFRCFLTSLTFYSLLFFVLR